jgi:acyl dehydratase
MYYEEFQIDKKIQTPVRKLTAADVESFIELSWLDNPIFLSDEKARETGHPGRIVPGPLQVAVAMGLCQRAGIFDHVVAVIRFDQMLFKRPVTVPVSLMVKAHVLETKQTSNPKRGKVVLKYELVDEKNRSTMTVIGTYLMRTKEN